MIGIDADAAAMADASRKAARPTRRGGVSNALFIAAAAEQLPGPLTASADLITIALPWGSLLRGLLSADRCLLDSITACLRDGGELMVLLSATERDAAADTTLTSDVDAARLAAAYRSAGLKVVDFRPADASDVSRLSSGWGRRLGIPGRRSAWLFRTKPVPLDPLPRVPCSTHRADARALPVRETGC